MRESSDVRPIVKLVLWTWIVVCVTALATLFAWEVYRQYYPDQEQVARLKREIEEEREAYADSVAIYTLIFGPHLSDNDAVLSESKLIEVSRDQATWIVGYKTKPFSYRRLVLRKLDGRWAVVEDSPSEPPEIRY